MNLEQYEKLAKQFGGVDIFRNKYVKSVPVNDVKQYEKSQVRAAGHAYHNIQIMMEDLKSQGQLVPASASKKGDIILLEEGNTRLEALRRIQKQTGEQQNIDVSFFHHQTGYDQSDWKKFKFSANAHIPSCGNTSADLLKVAGELYRDGVIDKDLCFCYDEDEKKYLDSMIKYVHEEIAHKTFSKNTVRSICKKILSDQAVPQNGLTGYDKTSAFEYIVNNNSIEWKGNKLGDSDNNISLWVVGKPSQLEKDCLSYAYRRRSPNNPNSKPGDKNVLVLYVENLAGRNENFIKKSRASMIKVVNKLNPIPGSGLKLWDEVYYMPQIKGEGSSLIKAKLA